MTYSNHELIELGIEVDTDSYISLRLMANNMAEITKYMEETGEKRLSKILNAINKTDEIKLSKTLDLLGWSKDINGALKPISKMNSN